MKLIIRVCKFLKMIIFTFSVPITGCTRSGEVDQERRWIRCGDVVWTRRQAGGFMFGCCQEDGECNCFSDKSN